MPVFVIGILYLINPSYIQEFFSKETNAPIPCGYCTLALAVILILAGYLVMNKLGKIDV